MTRVGEDQSTPDNLDNLDKIDKSDAGRTPRLFKSLLSST
jgi:hypothetical protein